MTDERWEWVQRYVGRGWPIFLLGNNKSPLPNCVACAPRVEGTCRSWEQCQHLTCHGFYAATTDLARLEEMLARHGDGMLALRTGGRAAGIIALDAEGYGSPTGLEVLDNWEQFARTDWAPPMLTLTQRTGSGGVHLLYQLPSGVELPSRNRILPQIDIKGDGGYIAVAMGGGDGRRWDSWTDEVAKMPPAMLTWLQTTKGGGGFGVGGDLAISMDEFKEIETKQWVPGGVREAFFTRFIFKLRKAGRAPWEIEDICRLWYEERTAQPPEAQWFMPWSDLEYKIARDCTNTNLDPDPLPPWNPAVALAGSLQPDPAPVGPAEEPGGPVEPPVSSPPTSGAGGGGSRRVDTLILDADDGSQHLTDSGNARRFVTLYGDVVRYVKDTGEWLVWSGTHWQPDDDGGDVTALTRGVIGDLRREALLLPDEAEGGGQSPRRRQLAWALASESKGARERMIGLAAKEFKSIRVVEDDLDADPFQLVVKNGTLDLRTGELRPSLSSDNNSRCCDAEYVEGAQSAMLDQFLETFLPDPDDQRFVFALLGHMLRGFNEGRFFPFLLGGTTSGKTQLAQAVLKLLDRYGCTINSSVFRGNLDDKPRPDLVKAMGTRVAVANEASKIWELHGDQVKRLTGGDAIPYRNLYAGMTERRPRFTPLIVANEMPRIRNADEALKRRMIVVEFDRSLSPEEEDPKIKERFLKDPAVLRALLWRLVVGSQDAIAGSLTNIPRKYMLATMKAFSELDHVAEFLAWMMEHEYLVQVSRTEAASSMAKASDLHKWYTNWVAKHGDRSDKHDALGLKDFSARLRHDGWESKQSAGTRWVGWRLANEAPWSALI